MEADSLADVGYWHLADAQTALMNVRFEGNNGHYADVTRCQLLTIGEKRNRTDCERHAELDPEIGEVQHSHAGDDPA
jgi:hypothetical protein